MLDASSKLTGGTTEYSPASVALIYQGVARMGSVYVLPSSVDGYLVVTGGATQTGGGTGAVAFLRTVISAYAAGKLGVTVGNSNVANIIGHEGSHLLCANEPTAYALSWIQTVNRRVGIVGVTVGSALLSGAWAKSTLPQGSCGDLSYWKLRATLVVYPAPSDARTPEELQTQGRIDLIKLAADEAQCRAQRGNYPTSLTALASPSAEVRAAVGRCVVDSALTQDAWTQPIEYQVLAKGGIRIRSSGPDLRFGTADDIELPAPKSPFRTTFELKAECFRE